MADGDKSSKDNLRIITPVLVSVAIFMLGMIITKTNDIDAKLFKHLTNDDIHTPKAIVVTQPEFKIYQEMRSREMETLREGLVDIKNLLEICRKEFNARR